MTSGKLKLGDQGIWFSENRSPISYPAAGNQACFQIEDDSFWFQHRNRCILGAMRAYPPNGTVYDVGGGNGYVSLAMQKSGYETVLVEPGWTGAQNARQRGLTNIICSTLEDAGFEAGTVPAIGIFDVLEHIPAAQTFLKQLRTALKPDGYLYITVPAYQFLWSAEDDVAGHVRRYTRSSLREEMSRAGFEIEYSTYFFSPLPLPILLLRTLPTRLAIDSSRDQRNSAREHVSSQKVGAVAGAIFNWELRMIADRRAIPFGSSCLVVARPRRAEAEDQN